MGKSIEIETIDLYRLLIGELRYAYSRNNHLQPSAAYDEAKKFLPEMLIPDFKMALITAKQLCEECISDQLSTNFSDGLDDEFGNRKEAIEFIEWLLTFIHENGDESYVPYNQSLYLSNLSAGNNLKYDLYKLTDFDFEKEDYQKANKELLFSGYKVDVDKELFYNILGCKEKDTITFNAPKITEKRKVIGEKLRIVDPVAHKGELYLILLSKSAEA